MLITPRVKPANGRQRFFSNGFRPLFLLCALQALAIMSVWLLYLEGTVSISAPPGWGAIAWHGHEMLFGFVGAAVGGFLLAAVSKWTGRPPVQGVPLILLSLLWIAGRLASWGVVTWSGSAQLALLVLVNTGYWVVLAGLVAREVLSSGNRRNLVVVLALVIMGLFSLMFQMGWVDRIHLLESQVLLVALMISLIGGRITPAFTRNWLMRRQADPRRMPAGFGWVDRAALGGSILATLTWVAQLPAIFSGSLLLFAGAAQLLRLLRWRGFSSVAEPLLFALHLGYLWVGVGFLLLGSSRFTASVPVSAGIHAIGVGAMAGMILAVAARAALGHTNRELRAGAMMSLAFLAIHLAALVRVLAAFMPQQSLMMLAGAIWLLAFLLFAVRYLPILIGPEESLSEALKREKTKVARS